MKKELSSAAVRSAAQIQKVPMLVPPRVVLLLTSHTSSGDQYSNLEARASQVTVVLTGILECHGIPHGGINE